MNIDSLMWFIFWGLLAWRAMALRKVLSIPKFHGPDYFFDSRVGADFYRTSELPRQYRRGILLPRIIEIAVIAVAGAFSHWNPLYMLMVQTPGTILTAWWQIRVSHQLARKAREIEGLPEAPPVVTAVLAPREAVNYRSPAYDWAVVGMAGTGTWLVLQDGYVESWKGLLLLLYLQIGLLLVKHLIMASRLFRVAVENPEPLLLVREEYRRWWLRMCDVLRIMLAGPLLIWGLMAIDIPALIPGLFLTLATGAYLTLKESNRILAVSKRAGPTPRSAPEPPLPPSRVIAGMFCWERDLSGMMIKTAGRHALNLANRGVYILGGYLTGLATLLVISFR